jgi:tripartite-type tricarboxylate transporter receptor subunit TctC
MAFAGMAAAAAVFATGSAVAEGWPHGTVQMVVPVKAGGGTDAAARLIAAALQEEIGQPVVVVNSDSGGGTVASEQVRTANPDGSSILFFHTGILTMNHTGGYDHSPLTDFSVIAQLPVAASYSLVVNANSPYKTLAELIAATKDKPNQISLGLQFRGTTHFMAGLLAKDSGAQFRMVEAGSDSEKLVQITGGQIDAALVNTPGSLQYVEKGDLRILATISGFPERDTNAPDYPTMHELGYTSAVYGIDFLILGPPGMDAADIEAVNAAFTTVLSDKELSDQLAKARLPITPMGVAESVERLKDFDAKVESTAKLLGLN